MNKRGDYGVSLGVRRGAGSAVGGVCPSRVAPVRPRTAGDVPARRGAASRTISAAARSGANCRESTRPGSLNSSPGSRPARPAGRAGSRGEQVVISPGSVTPGSAPRRSWPGASCARAGVRHSSERSGPATSITGARGIPGTGRDPCRAGRTQVTERLPSAMSLVYVKINVT